MNRLASLVHAWLVIDFFGEARRSGGAGSTLTTTVFTQSFLALVFATLLYPETAPVPFAAANLCLSSLLLGLGALSDTESRNRTLADQVLLATAPIGRTGVQLARAAYGAFYICLLTIGMALPPAVLLAFLQQDFWLAPAYLLAACACSGLAAGILGVILRWSRRLLGTMRTALLLGTLKALALGFGLVLFALALPQLRHDAAALPIGRFGAELLPPYHCARLLADPLGEAWRWLPLLAGGVGLLVLGALAGEGENARSERIARGGLLHRLDRVLAPSGPRLGLTAFVATMIWRSPGFRARVLPLFGMPAAMAYLALQGGDERGRQIFLGIVLQFPAIYLPFLIAFLPRADQPDTAWVFDSGPALPLAMIRGATWRALVTHVLVPIHALGLALLLASGQPVVAAVSGAAFALGVGTLIAQPMLERLHVMPFTWSGDEEGADLGGLMAFALALAVVGAGFAALPWPWARPALAAGALILAAVRLRRST